MTLPHFHARLNKRPYSRAELIADGVVHVAAIMAGLAAFASLLTFVSLRGETSHIVALVVYAAGFFMMFGFSFAYNMTPVSKLKWALRRFDHSAIYVMIAATYTAFLAPFAGEQWGWILMAVVWSAAIAGCIIKLAMPGRYDNLGIALYVLLGWAALFVFQPIVDALPLAALVLLVAGGVTYTAGVVFYKWHSLRFQNAIWHSFVAVGAGLHLAGVTVNFSTLI